MTERQKNKIEELKGILKTLGLNGNDLFTLGQLDTIAEKAKLTRLDVMAYLRFLR